MYTSVAYLTVAIWFVFVLYGLIFFMVYWTEAYSEPCKTSKMQLYSENRLGVKAVNLKKTLSQTFDKILNRPLLNINCLTRFCYIFQHTLCLKEHVYCAISVQLDLNLKCYASQVCTIVYSTEYILNTFRTLQRLAAATKMCSGKQKVLSFRETTCR